MSINLLKNNLFIMGMRHPNIITLGIILLGTSLIFVITHFLPPTRVGDGSEYYAMYLAWKYTLHPYMTVESWTLVDILSNSEHIHGFVSLEQLKEAFPTLRLGETADFNHFWFYSALAAMMSGLFSLIDIKLSAHTAFIVTHWALYCLPMILAYRYFRWQGLLSVLALTFLSPMFWYIDKVHVEFFTFCLTLSSVIVFLKRKYMLSALFLAIASTQNISFAVVAFVPFAIYFFESGEKTNPSINIVYASLASIFVLLHPVYYFSRFGVITPQLLHPSVELGVYSRVFYIWLFDPDVGLLPNWPLGIMLLIVGAYSLLHKKWLLTRKDYYLIFFIAIYLIVSLYAQSSTRTLNSAATPGISRYALWYIPLFFPLALHLIHKAQDSFCAKLSISFLCFIAFSYTLAFQGPHLFEHTHIPSPASQLIQRYLPRIYNPPPLLFVGRYSNVSSHAQDNVRAVIGPDCRKILVIPGAHRQIINGSSACKFSNEKLESLIINKLNTMSNTNEAFYFRLTQQEANQLRYTCLSNVDFAKNAYLPIAGFSFAESHGRWTDGKQASFTCHMPSDANFNPTKVRVHATAFTYDGHTQHVMVSINNSNPMEYIFLQGAENKVIEVMLPNELTDTITIEFLLPDAISPYELGFNADHRELAITVSAIEFL